MGEFREALNISDLESVYSVRSRTPQRNMACYSVEEITFKYYLIAFNPKTFLPTISF
jgi:hypothetical protein